MKRIGGLIRQSSSSVFQQIMTQLKHKNLTQQIIGSYYNVFNGLSRTYPEAIYEKAMLLEMQERQIICRQQDEYRIYYKDILVGVQRLDLFVADEVVVELKVVPELTGLHKAQAISYLKVTGKQVGLLCNFGSTIPQFERLYFTLKAPVIRAGEPKQTWPENYLEPALTDAIIGALYEVHVLLGPGFIYRIYANAVYHELKMRGIAAAPQKTFAVFYRGQTVGHIKFDHLQIEGQLLLFPVAIQDMSQIHLDNIRAYLREERIPLGLVANFHPESLDFLVLRA